MDEYDAEAEPRSRRWAWTLLLLILAFAGGMVAAGLVVTRDVRIAGWLRLEPVATAHAQQQATIARAIAIEHSAPPVLASAPAADAQLAARVNTLQAQVADIEDEARAATGDASRAEGLLVAFAARRALDRGMGLGYIEGLLRQRFGQEQPQAVAAIISAAQRPVTLTDLQTGLDAIAAQLASGGGSPNVGWWTAFRRGVADLIVVRHAGDAPTDPADRVQRAQHMLEAGEVDRALAEIVRIPDHQVAESWIFQARRYVGSRAALDRIETAALLDPANPPAGLAGPRAPGAGRPGAVTPAATAPGSPPARAQD